ncbi:DUF6339 family protein [Virgibacillus soli]|uniref:DUF6339 family protein n=1 Tax=Paracerasibacillus soli TaxID=480284 RepID=UPI0035EEE12E
MKLTFLSDETLQDLRTNYEEYKEHYYTKDDAWFNDYLSLNGRVLESKVDFQVPEMNMSDDFLVSDAENVKNLYEALRHLNLSQATDERIWAGLAHLQLRDYAFHRLKKEREAHNDKRINTGYFLKAGGMKRSLFVHILARLWWVGHMTYDETNKENPFWLTEFFCEADFSARSVVFFSSNFTSNRAITRGILRALVSWKQKGNTIKRDHFVQATKYLNVVGGAMILDTLTMEEVEKMVGERLEQVFGIVETLNV